jgi:hypothetical protein
MAIMRRSNHYSSVKILALATTPEAGLNTLNNDAGDRLVIPVTFWAKLRF